MVFWNKEINCTYGVLLILNKGTSKYKLMYREIKVSHTILQKVLKTLLRKGFITRQDLGHMKVNYQITKEGQELFETLNKLQKLIF